MKNTLLSRLFSDHTAAQRAITELRRTPAGGSRIGVLLRRITPSAMTASATDAGLHIGEDDVALLAPLGTTLISADGRFLAGGVLAARMRDRTGGSTAEALLGLGMRPEDMQESLRCVEDGDILVLIENAPQSSAIRHILASTDDEIANIQADEIQGNPPAPQP